MIAIILGTRQKSSRCPRSSGNAKQRTSTTLSSIPASHYSYDMDRAFFEDLELPEPKYNLDVGSGTHAEQTGG